MIEEQGVEEVTIMGKSSHSFGISHGKVIRLDTVTGKEYLVTFQPEGVSPEAQVEGQVVHTEIRTIPHDDEGSKILMLSQPIVKGSPDGWVKGVLGDDGEHMGKG